MDLEDGGQESLAGGLAFVDAIMLWASTFCFGIHMSFDFLFIGFGWICNFVHPLIGFCLCGVCLLEETYDCLGCGFLTLFIWKLASTGL
jgi:hypothetical protein